MKKLSLLVIAFALSGCGGNGMQAAAVTPAMSRSASAPTRSNGTGRLIYAIGSNSNTIDFYSYRKGTLEGAIIKGPDGPQGMCSDPQGNVFVANAVATDVIEFAHGGMSPLQKLPTVGEFPEGCAVAPNKTLAVTALTSTDDRPGELLLFSGETGSPTILICPNLDRYYFDAYDGDGNLFVDGESSDYKFALCEIPKGSSTGIAISLYQSPGFPGGVQWDGKYIAILDQDQSEIDRYSISGSTGTLKGMMLIGGPSGQEFIGFVMANRKTVLASSVEGTGIGYYHYPNDGDGNPYKILEASRVVTVTVSPLAKL